MKRLEVSGALRPIYGLLGVKRLTQLREELQTPAVLTSGNAREPTVKLSGGFHSQHERGVNTMIPTLTGPQKSVFLLVI